MSIDLNADLGEGAPGEAEILDCISSANIACGGHAGDEGTMRATVRRARERGVAIGAHPAFEDRANFGRVEQRVTPAEVRALVGRQVLALRAIAAEEGAVLAHVKPHGALYNQAARAADLAAAVAAAVREIDPGLKLFGLAGSALVAAAEAAGLRGVSEAFADRRYRADGSLVPRSEGAAALIADEEEALRHAMRLAREGVVVAVTGEVVRVRAETICVHGDSPQAVGLARRLRELLAAGRR